MDQMIFTELRTLYSLNWGRCNVIRIRARMRDLVEPDALHHAVGMITQRYPYFCVELKHDHQGFCTYENRGLKCQGNLLYQRVSQSTSLANARVYVMMAMAFTEFTNITL